MAETTRTTLPKTVFAVNVPNHKLLKLAYDAYLATQGYNDLTRQRRIRFHAIGHVIDGATTTPQRATYAVRDHRVVFCQQDTHRFRAVSWL